MAKFHINGNGEAGACSATEGRCPFGGDEHHYPSKAAANQAFELSMANRTFTPLKDRVSFLNRDPVAIFPGQKTWREIGGQTIDDPGRDSEAMGYGLDAEDYLDLEDIRAGITLPRDRRERRKFIKYVEAKAKGEDITGFKKEVASQLIARLDEKPGSDLWENRTALISKLNKLAALESQAARGAEQFEWQAHNGKNRKERAYGVIGRARDRFASSVHREDIIQLKGKLASSSIDEIAKASVRTPSRLYSTDAESLATSKQGAVIHAMTVNGLLGNKFQEKVYDRTDDAWIERASGETITPQKLAKELFVEPDDSKKPGMITLYSA